MCFEIVICTFVTRLNTALFLFVDIRPGEPMGILLVNFLKCFTTNMVRRKISAERKEILILCKILGLF